MLKLLSRHTLKKFLRNPRHSLTRAWNKIRQQSAARSSHGASPFADNLTFFLTYRCNLRCRVCGQWGDHGYVKNLGPESLRDEVDIATLQRVIDEVAGWRPEITLCGGEVLLYDQWFEFMSYIKKRGLTCILTTNGTFLADQAEKIISCGLDKLSLSLDGPEAIHDSARGGPGTFRKAMAGIRAINRLKKERGVAKPQVEIGCTISARNYPYLREVVSMAGELEASCLIFLHLIFLYDQEFTAQQKVFQERFLTESTQWGGYRSLPENMNIDDLIGTIRGIQAEKLHMPVIFHPDLSDEEIREYYQKPFFRSKSYKNICLAPWTTAYILPNGDVSPCSNYVAGNIRQESLQTIWNNDRFRDFRRELKQRGTFPACVRCCELYKH